ncbi:MAG: shikimate dehydrogenase [Gammaproteobacteria bacterium]|nr:shikimate dehydrogenase [Gammaproteobacteria bacterium]
MVAKHINEQRYAVFGHPIKHSLSPRIHRHFAEQTGQKAMSYTAIDVPAETFKAAVTDFYNQGGKGLNCTVPLKELAYDFADDVSARAQRCGAVNTLMFKDDGSLYGDNTDGIGLIRDLTVNLNIPIQDRTVLILGAGGATRGILEMLLNETPKQVCIVNRTQSKAHDLAELFAGLGYVTASGYQELNQQSFDLIINATAASLHGDLPPLPNTLLADNGYCYDLAYALEPTPFVKWGIEHGADISVDGIGMLVEQAAEAFYIWRGVYPETRLLIESNLLKQKQ